jgi:CheY-like chemotaxis protein
MHAISLRNAPLVAILEDDPFQRIWFERVLERAAFRVRTHPSPHEFLARRAERPLPDLLLLDIILPEMDAFQVLAELEIDENWCLVPVVLMTATASQDKVILSQKLLLRPEGFLVKPVATPQMLRLFRTICDRQDPGVRLRDMYRRRRSIEISMQSVVRELEEAVEDLQKCKRESAQGLAESRRQAQQLSLLDATDRLPGAQKESVARMIHQAEAEAAQSRQLVRKAEAAQRRVLIARQAVVRHRRKVQELDADIRSLAEEQNTPT